MFGTGRATLALFSLLLLSPLSPAVARAEFATSFETPTYVSGSIVSQDSWTGGAAPRVQTATELDAELTAAGLNPANPVHSGTQAVIVTGTGGSSSTFRPITGLESSTVGVLDVWARPLTRGAEDTTIGTNLGNVFFTLEDSSGVRAAAIRFGATVTDEQLESTSIDVYSETPTWTATGVAWQPDAWYNLRLVADYAAKTYDVLIDGVQVRTDVQFYDVDSANLSRIRMFRGSGQAGMIVDDLAVSIPEPGAAALLIVGSALLLTKRRRS